MQQRSTLLSLVKKYNVPGPRYTSYPTALQFSDVTDTAGVESCFESRKNRGKELSLYFHIPFCFSLCWYCGCTKIITKDQDRGDIYLDYLEKEVKLVNETLHTASVVRQIHFGGGTPTFLSPEQLLRLGSIIKKNFTIHTDAEFSVEIDPRRVEIGHISALQTIGCNRASLGVQDTNEEVQKAIHRIQPFEQTADVTNMLRDHSISNINLDLIYGLPKQSRSTFRKTMDDVVSLKPDRFAIYSYAHIPSVMPAQKLLNEEDFPSTEEKLSMLVDAVEILPGLGYRFIGMDHFAKENDELSRALAEGTLQRNFQGYSTHAELEMIAIGMSGISQGKDFYYQNEKDLGRYYQMLDNGKLPVKKILRLTAEDKLRKKLIMQIMCDAKVDYQTFYDETGVFIPERFSHELQQLRELETDGLLQISETGFRITSEGRMFLRNAAMVFDGYIQQKHHKTAYSKTV